VKYTEICNCTVLQLAAIDRAIRSPYQHALVLGEKPWTGRGRSLLDRLRTIRGLNVIEEYRANGPFVVLAGSIGPSGFTKEIR
jgi:hypothetical protein